MKSKQNTLDVLVTAHINKFQEALTLEQRKEWEIKVSMIYK